MTSVAQQLDRLVREYEDIQTAISWPTTLVESDWLSPCLIQPYTENEMAAWRPTLRATQNDMFDRLSEALETEIPEALVTFYTRYLSLSLYMQHPEGHLSLIQVWNDKDMERLRENLIGHALNKRRLKQPLSLFIGVTEPDGQQIISVELQSGQVLLETPGKKPFRVLADDLESFLSQLTAIAHPNE